MTNSTIRKAWYALRVRSNSEHRTSEWLRSIGCEVFHPTYRDRRQWSDRVTELEVPLFKGYLFCHIDIERRMPILQTPGVVDFVRFGRMFVPIEDEEIGAVRSIVSSPAFARPCPYLNVGDRVRVTHGPLTGIEGLLVERQGDTHLVVSVHLLQRSVMTRVNLDWIRPLNSGFSDLPSGPTSQSQFASIRSAL